MNEMSIGVAQSDVKIQTFVFFDLETTGLIRGSHIPKITEMSLVATSRDSMFNTKGDLPRVMHKLTIPFQPMKPIPLEVSEITGLYNDSLEPEKPFDRQAYELLNSFLGRLNVPICFVAHNGVRFDYPILLSALNHIGKNLSETILCIDSILAFEVFFSHKDNKNSCTETSLSQSGDKNAEYFNDGLNSTLCELLDSCLPNSVENDCLGAVNMNDGMTCQQVNETTPTRKAKSPKKTFGLAAKKRLPFTVGRPKNLKLITVYEHLVGKAPINSHSAEADCLATLTCAMKMCEFFVDWADKNASPLVQYAKNN